jgi:adhesin transport system outer membrane protein
MPAAEAPASAPVDTVETAELAAAQIDVHTAAVEPADTLAQPLAEAETAAPGDTAQAAEQAADQINVHLATAESGDASSKLLAKAEASAPPDTVQTAAAVAAVVAPPEAIAPRQDMPKRPSELDVTVAPAINAEPPVKTQDIPTNPSTQVSNPNVAAAANSIADSLLNEIVYNGSRILEMSGTTRPAPTFMEPLRLDEAVALALSKNPEVLAASSKEDVARWQQRSAYSQYLPAVEINYAQGVERSAPGSYNDANASRVAKTVHFRRDRLFSIRQPIVDTTIVTDIFRSSANISLAEAEKRDAFAGIVFDTVSTYLKLLRARLAIHLADDYQKQLDDLGSRMAARVRGGGAANVDLDRVKGRYASAKAARLEAIGDYNINLAEFQRITSVVPAQLVLPERLIPETPEGAETALERVVRENPVYRSALSKIDLAAADRNKSFAGLLPKLSAEYTKTMTHGAGGSAHGNPIDGLYPNQTDSRFMVVAKWSLNGGTSLAEGLAGVAKVREMKFRAQDVLNRVTQSVTTGYGALYDARDRASVLQEAYAADTRVVRDFEVQYKSGARSLFDMLDAYERRYRSQLDLVKVYIDQAQAAYLVRRQLGDIAAAVMTGADNGRR